MVALARLWAIVLMIIGIALFLGDALQGSQDGSWLLLVRWQWGLVAMAAGVLGAALLAMAEAMLKRAE